MEISAICLWIETTRSLNGTDWLEIQTWQVNVHPLSKIRYCVFGLARYVCVCDILCVWCDSSIADTFTTHQNSKQTNQTNERTGNKGNNNNSKCRLLIRFNPMIFYIPMNWHTFALWNCHSVWMWRARVCFYVIYSMINFIRIKNEPQFNAMSVTNSNGTALHQRCIVSRCQKNNKQNSTLIHIELFVQSHSLRSIEHRFNDFHFFFRIFNLPTIRTLYTFYIAIENV